MMLEYGPFGSSIAIASDFGFRPASIAKLVLIAGGIDVAERARNLRGVEFDDLQLLRVLDDVERRRLQSGVGAQLEQALLLEQQQRAAAVGRIVRHGDGGAGGSSARVFTFFE